MKRPLKSAVAGYGTFLEDIARLLEDSRRAAGRAVNSVITITYYEIGRRIVEQELKGKERAGYGDQLMILLARDLSTRFGRGFSFRNVFQMRQFFLAYRGRVQGEPERSRSKGILQTLSAKSAATREITLA